MNVGRRAAVVLAVAMAWTTLTAPLASADDVVPPTAVDDVVTVLGPAPVTVDVLANDVVTAPASISVPVAPAPGSPAHGTVAVVPSADGQRPVVVYTALASWYGEDAFSYSVVDASGVAATASVHVTVTPSPPVARPDSASTTRTTAVSVAVLANDADPYADPLHIVSVSHPKHGTARVVDGHVVYLPAARWTGRDTFDYVVVARSGAQATATATVTTSAPVVVVVALVSPSSISVSTTSRLTGTVSSLTRGVPSVTLQYRDAGGWHFYARTDTDSSGAFSAVFTSRSPGVLTWRAMAAWTDGTLLVSRPFTTTVLASAAPIVSGPLTPADVPFSWRPGCPVAPAGLRRLTLSYWGYDGAVHRGEIIVATAAVRAVSTVLSAAYAAHFPIRSMVPVDAYYGGGTASPTESDIASMAAGNTSGFNCRSVTGESTRVSQHSYGNAIDINPFENPYATATTVYPQAAADRYYRDRSLHAAEPGVVTSRSVVAVAFAAVGWQWGARWARHDFQHFSENGG